MPTTLLRRRENVGGTGGLACTRVCGDNGARFEERFRAF